MILVTGPTGSGKSTTLYSLLAERNDPGTVEDPIEYTLPGITQCLTAGLHAPGPGRSAGGRNP